MGKKVRLYSRWCQISVRSEEKLITAAMILLMVVIKLKRHIANCVWYEQCSVTKPLRLVSTQTQ